MNRQTLPTSLTGATFFSLLLLSLSLMTQGCGDVKFNELAQAASSRPRFAMVLIDETSSFDYWDEMRESVQQVISNLQPEESFGLLGIDESGFDDLDVRIPIRQLDENALKAIMQRKEWVREVDSLERRGNPPRTDIYGSLNHAAHFMNRKEQEGFEPVLILFTDMIHTARKRDNSFVFYNAPKAYCFYVNASGKSSWQALVDEWVPTLQAAGLNLSEKDFYQSAETTTALQKIFPRMSH